MNSHFLDLTGASVLQTRHFLMTREAVSDVTESGAIGAIVGPAGLGRRSRSLMPRRTTTLLSSSSLLRAVRRCD